MALQVWLPLNGDLHNQGLSNITFSALTTNTSINASGKIGACYQNNSHSAGGLISNAAIALGIKQSMFCWFKFTDLEASSSLGGGLVSQHRYQSNKGMGITIKYVSATTGYLSVNTGNGSSRTYNTYYGTTLLQANTWYHGGYTYDGNNIRIYLNGTLEKTQAFTGMSVPAEYLTVFCWSMSGTSGNTVHGDYKLNGCINDVRVYDHCLSDKEIEDISKGLILHYQLNNNTMILTKYDKEIYTEPDSSQWLHIARHNSPGTSGYFTSDSSFETGVYLDENRWYDVSIINLLNNFEFMVKQKTTSNATETKYRWVQTKNPLLAVYNDVKPTSVTRITTSGYTDGTFGGLWKMNSNTRLCIANTSASNWYGAIGCWTAYQNGIPGYPNTTITTGYIDLYVRIDNQFTNIYDSSGYNHNGEIINNLTTDIFSPKYNLNTKFSASPYIRIGKQLYNMRDEMTVTLWCKKTWGSNVGTPFSSVESGGFGWQSSGANYNFYCGTGVSSNTYISSAVSVSGLSEGWHMLSATYDGLALRIYIDGELKNTVNKYTTKTQIYYNNNSGMFISGESAGSLTAPSGSLFNGNLSDVRIYATALTPAQIKELYETSKIVDGTTVKARDLEVSA